MDEREKRAATEKYEAGSYFQDALKWYQVVYLNPLSERFFFLIVLALSLLIVGFSLIALGGLMPLAPRVPFYYGTANADSEVLSLEPLRTISTEQSVDDALLRFYVKNYVQRREAYNAREFTDFTRFIQRHSKEGAFNEYRRLVNVNNPRSPVRRYGRTYERQIAVESVTLSPPENPTQAQVRFVSTVQSKSDAQKTYWTASLRFSYSGLTFAQDQTTEAGTVKTLPDFAVTFYESKEQVR